MRRPTLAVSAALAISVAAGVPTSAFARQSAVSVPAAAKAPCVLTDSRPWCNTTLSPDRRADLLQKRMTTTEKIDFLNGVVPGVHAGESMAIPRLGIPAVNYTDGPVGAHPSSGEATALPIPMALAATFDPQDAYRYGKEIATEAKHKGDDVVFGPTVNLMRTPEGGRTYEAYGEDPFLVANTAVGWIDGAQSTGVLADVKHFAENNQEGQLGAAPLTGTDGSRILVDANVSPRVMHENELEPFEAAVKMAHVATVMCAYNRVNGAFSCSNSYLLQRTLEKQWGFKGYVLSDYGAAHSTVGNLNHGLDFEPSFAVTIPSLSSYFAPEIQVALATHLVTMSTIDGHIHRILRTWFAYGIFDRPPFRISAALTNKHADARTAEQVEQSAAVLLKNSRHLLPLHASKVHSIAVIGQYADKFVTGGGSGDVHPYSTVTTLQGIRRALRGHHATIRYAEGKDIAAAVAAAKASKYAVVVVGDVESEGQDKSCIGLNCVSDLTESTVPTNTYPCSIPNCPPNAGDETALIKAVAAANPRTIVVLETGAPVLTDWRGKVPALLEAWYPGEQGGTAIANLLLGKADPAGRLPATFPNSASQLPTAGSPASYPGLGVEEYYSEGLDVGYRWYLAHHLTPAYPFGYGLSYTSFRFSQLAVTTRPRGGAGTIATVSVRVTNTGTRSGRAVPELYLALPQSKAVPEPPLQLRGYQGVTLAPGHSTMVTFPLNARSFAHYDAAKDTWQVRRAGCFGVRVGSSVNSLPLRA
ncbi:MAG TPA: glycoside hydrolase family 3 C-terminal domain-containing protein, partial [Mycobacteriales bacterium]|nr:glycoside hydrolase family 3 C-terminal domain-containing protein [Mycobacteriales bacterium]